MRSLELRALCIAAIATLFTAPALTATTETAREGFTNWYYVAQSLTYGGYEAEGLSFYANYEYERLSAAVSTSGQSEHNGTTPHIQFAFGPLRLAIPVRLRVSDTEVYAVGGAKSWARFYALSHTGTPITVKVTGANPQSLQLLQLSPRSINTGTCQLEAVYPVSRGTDQ